MVFLAVVAVSLSTAAMPGNAGPYSTSQWTNGPYVQQIGRTEGTRSVIDLNGLANGVYFVRAEQPGGMGIPRWLMVASAAQSVSP